MSIAPCMTKKAEDLPKWLVASVLQETGDTSEKRGTEDGRYVSEEAVTVILPESLEQGNRLDDFSEKLDQAVGKQYQNDMKYRPLGWGMQETQPSGMNKKNGSFITEAAVLY